MRSNAFILILSLFSVLLNAKEEIRALDYLNTVRQNSGLIPLKENKLLNRAALSHANYLVLQQKLGHIEQYNHKGYTGKTPAERVVYFGYPSKDVMENIAVNTKNGITAIDDLLAAIYHRFVFLSIDKDEIGIGRASTGKFKPIKDAYVFNLGSSKLNALCQKVYVPLNQVIYLQNVCKDGKALIPQALYEENQNEIKSQNTKVVLHPYPGQKEVMTVFYNEEPDPLPDYDVSGYPISVQFNDRYVSSVQLTSFRLFDDKHREIVQNRVFTYENDPQKYLKKTQFALMPLKRLEYATTYRVEFEAEVDGERYQKSWKFTTKRFNDTLYRITNKTTQIDAEPGSTLILYFVPNSHHDVLKGFSATHGLKVSFIDNNTLKVNITDAVVGAASIKAGGRTILFK
ncbi:CAP domain-containing protein [Sulfurovum sp. zt1-1]|uniref:CAP domain-containing protein n=1 Tax=Sulfurovum zhangzhouensis TaxID=3019067 RepID=A0ABT7R001_9BACT|nr:CAP domain-containing protein [Sulfurovum zhangzhouensis]MDM5271821.1 CAP domain-containing protein [Sulfurovum zhangzhouensis]